MWFQNGVRVATLPGVMVPDPSQALYAAPGGHAALWECVGAVLEPSNVLIMLPCESIQVDTGRIDSVSTLRRGVFEGLLRGRQCF